MYGLITLRMNGGAGVRPVRETTSMAVSCHVPGTSKYGGPPRGTKKAKQRRPRLQEEELWQAIQFATYPRIAQGLTQKGRMG